ncbi:MAG: FtsX-like permease family protein [Streptococcus salivarius]
MKRVQFWGIIATALLTIVAVLLISNTIRITIMSRATEIQIMRLVGAKNSYIRRPYLMEGAWIGALGAIIPSGLIYLLYHMVYSTLNPDFVKGGVSMYDPEWFVYAVIGTLFAVGIYYRFSWVSYGNAPLFEILMQLKENRSGSLFSIQNAS